MMEGYSCFKCGEVTIWIKERKRIEDRIMWDYKIVTNQNVYKDSNPVGVKEVTIYQGSAYSTPDFWKIEKVVKNLLGWMVADKEGIEILLDTYESEEEDPYNIEKVPTH